MTSMMTRIKSYRLHVLAVLSLIAMCAPTPTYAQNFSVLYQIVSGGPTEPAGRIAQGRDGSLYITSSEGGTYARGAVFKVTAEGRAQVLYNFCSQSNCADGSDPDGGLILRADGHFLGVTSTGGAHNWGTIFDITQTGSLTTIYNFTGGTDGGAPLDPPILGPDGSFYGVAAGLGLPSGCGTIYRITNGVFALLHDFGGPNGCQPDALVLGTDGNFYGTTESGGTAGGGVFYRVTYRPGKATLVTVLYNFGAETFDSPHGPLVEGSDGNFYGTAFASGGAGVVFKITPSGVPTVLYNMSPTDGTSPLTSVIQATDGNFYGATGMGGSSPFCNGSGCGTLFQVTPAGGFSVLHSFDVTTGAYPYTPFQNTNGFLYGVTDEGGACARCGVVYSWGGSVPAFVSTVPFMAKVGSFVEILGQGFTSATTVSFNGMPSTATVVSGTYVKATVPAGATTGFVTVTTSAGTLTSNRPFVVMP